ncbi:MAG TPA: homocysteine S-methyltransferase family protein, partial [Burkholderiales bacterium]|nr:homocysteine S-methyltransferase family protein [Burkholderiales bacterium]
MNMQRSTLPQLGGELFLADGGLETTLVFHEGVDLPHFAAFALLETREGTERLRNYFLSYVDVARRSRRGIVLETPTWRANPDWGAKLGYDMRRLGEANRRGVELLTGIRADLAAADTTIVISGNFGPRGDGYRPQLRMSVDQARAYHCWQMEIFADTDADMAAAFTMNYTEEAIGIALAAQDSGMPVAISFTVETDGRLPSGSALSEAIERTDEATAGYPAYYMINCAHP